MAPNPHIQALAELFARIVLREYVIAQREKQRKEQASDADQKKEKPPGDGAALRIENTT